VKIARFPKYDFNEDGYVVSFVNKNPRVLKPIKMGVYIGLQLLRDDGLIEKQYLHSLIAEAAYGECPTGMECRHLDGDKNNNSSVNLKWGTRRENTDDKILHGTSGKGENNTMAKLTDSDVLSMRKHREKTGDSHAKIGVMFNVSTMTAYRAVEGVSWKHLS
jgi:hypothetical protein